MLHKFSRAIVSVAREISSKQAARRRSISLHTSSKIEQVAHRNPKSPRHLLQYPQKKERLRPSPIWASNDEGVAGPRQSGSEETTSSRVTATPAGMLSVSEVGIYVNPGAMGLRHQAPKEG
jgi:hypothetical protein